jgi:hypothetical protein
MRLANILELGIKELRGLARDPALLFLIVYAFTLNIYTAATAEPESEAPKEAIPPQTYGQSSWLSAAFAPTAKLSFSSLALTNTTLTTSCL